ncbi:hypothetical protein NP493_121g04040 [Ridgeia piscesae]|uniref:Uncharacterized protein n=1 Tax=Ridgeia piscesae TaxID=27915 RepID=A0AAD9P5Z8_RIDPI|nr:hypothetical protein NP493_121g04040 [Ridgeia piscesae]
MNEQQHQRLTLEVTAIGQQDALSLVKPTRTKGITTFHQRVAAFTVYAAVFTEHSPHQAPGLFKHVADITEMARRFGGMAWCRYNQAFRREMGANHLMFGQVNWDLRFRCLEQASHKPGNYSFRGNATRTTAASLVSTGDFKKGNATNSSSLAHAPVLRSSSNTPVQSVPISTSSFAAPCALPVLNPSDELVQCALPTPIDNKEIPFPNFQSSPLGLVPKHDPGKLRLIHDLSFPKVSGKRRTAPHPQHSVTSIVLSIVSSGCCGLTVNGKRRTAAHPQHSVTSIVLYIVSSECCGLTVSGKRRTAAHPQHSVTSIVLSIVSSGCCGLTVNGKRRTAAHPQHSVTSIVLYIVSSECCGLTVNGKRRTAAHPQHSVTSIVLSIVSSACCGLTSGCCGLTVSGKRRTAAHPQHSVTSIVLSIVSSGCCGLTVSGKRRAAAHPQHSVTSIVLSIVSSGCCGLTVSGKRRTAAHPQHSVTSIVLSIVSSGCCGLTMSGKRRTAAHPQHSVTSIVLYIESSECCGLTMSGKRRTAAHPQHSVTSIVLYIESSECCGLTVSGKRRTAAHPQHSVTSIVLYIVSSECCGLTVSGKGLLIRSSLDNIGPVNVLQNQPSLLACSKASWDPMLVGPTSANLFGNFEVAGRPCELAYEGIRGATVATLLSPTVMSRVVARRADIVVLHIGGNDICGRAASPPIMVALDGLRLRRRLLEAGTRRVVVCQVCRRSRWRGLSYEDGAAQVIEINRYLEAFCRDSDGVFCCRHKRV